MWKSLRHPHTTGAIFRHPFFVLSARRSQYQATAVWAWSNTLHRSMPPDRVVLHINFDETSVPLFKSTHRGHLVSDARKRKRTPRSLHRPFGRAILRTQLTFVAFVCDSVEVQFHLPQFVLVPNHAMSEDEFIKLQGTLPSCCLLRRLKKAWVTQSVMLDMIDILETRLRRFSSRYASILYCDAFSPHCASSVLRRLGALRIAYCCVPAGLTWALQPCDTHVFRGFKHRLDIEVERRACSTAHVNSRVEDVIFSLHTIIAEFLNMTPWQKAFVDLGLIGHQRELSDTLRQKLGFPPSTIVVPPTMVTLQQLECIFPRGRLMNVDDLFACFFSPLPSSVISSEACLAP